MEVCRKLDNIKLENRPDTEVSAFYKWEMLMPKIFMFINVDWFFLSHRLPIAMAAAGRGIQMTVFTDFTQTHDEEYKGFALRQSPIRRAYNNFFSLCMELCKTFALIRRERPAVIHAVSIKPILCLGIICFILRIPFIASVSGLGPAFLPSGYWGKARLYVIRSLYCIIFFPENTRVICQSNNDADVLVHNRLVLREKIIMVDGSGVDLEEFRPLPSVESGSINVLMASRLLADKGIREFCAAAGVISREHEYNVSFNLAGPIDLDSPGALTEERVIEMCESNGVQFLGSRNDLKDILSKTNIFVLPSYYAEGIPKVLIEAAASGCAVITTDHPGCRDAIVPGKTGILAAPKDVLSLVNSLICLLTERDLMISMGRAGREMATKRFCVTKVVDVHYSLYQTLEKG